jgi:flagellar secretion chaperone FliS
MMPSYRDPAADPYGSYHAVNLRAQSAQASPLQLVLMLIDGVLEEAARLRMHLSHGRYEMKAASIGRCVDILNGLSGALDADAGNEIVDKLAALYDYCVRRLHQAGFDMDPAPVDEVTGLLVTLRGGWQGAVDGHV